MAQNVIINGVTYQSCPEVDIPKASGGTAKFFDTTSADAAAGDILRGETPSGALGSHCGIMSDNGSSGGTISLASSAVSDLVAGNILRNKTILGVTGTLDMVSVSQDGTTKVLSIS